MGVSLVLVLIGLQWGGNPYPWTSGRVLGPLVSGIVGLIAFGCYEALAKPRIPLISGELVSQVRVFVFPYVVIATSAMGYYALNILWPLMIATLYTTDAKVQSYYQMATPVAALVGAFIYGAVAKRIKNYKWQIVVAATIQAAFTAAMAASNKDSRIMSTAFVVVAGFCLVFLQLNAQLAITTQVPPRLL
jgi:hypothetical protein